MRLRSFGDGGPNVVKLAGLAAGVGLCREEVEAAAGAGFRVIAMDTAGDRADDPAPGPITWDFLAREVLEGLDSLRVERAILWGTSFGCLVALAAASRRPERVAGLLLCHPPDPLERPRYQRAAFRWAESRPRPVEAAQRLFTTGFRLLAAWEALYPTTLVRVPGLLRANREAATPPSTVRDKFRLMMTGPPGFPPRGAGIPVSIVAAAWDTVAPLREARRLAAALPGARLSVLAASGHSAAYSRPRAYKRLVLAELRHLATSAGPSVSQPGWRDGTP